MEWTRQWWIHQYPKAERARLAHEHPLAWVLEYEPKIRVPGKGYITYEPFYCQQQLLLDSSQFRHLNKPRQAGYTTTFSIEALHDLIYTPTAEIVVISKSEKEAKRFLDKFYVAYDSIYDKDPNCPKLLVRNAKNAIASNGATIDVLTSSKGAGRSFSATRLYFDETAHSQFADEIYQSSVPSISITNGKVTLFSTPKGRAGLFAEIGRKNSEYEFSKHRYEWWFVPAYNEGYKAFLPAYLAKQEDKVKATIDEARKGKWYRRTRVNFSQLAWEQEFECSYEADVDHAFNGRQMKAAFRRNWLEEAYDEKCGDFWTSKPRKGHHYWTGTDLGRKRDATVIATFDVTSKPAELVEYKRIKPQSADWGLIELSIRDTYVKFESEMVHDATGVGDPISELIIDISDPYVMTGGAGGKSKYNIIENLRRAMDNQAIKLPRIQQIWREFEDYKWQDKSIVQDSVIAIALVVYTFYEPESVWTGVDLEVNYAGELYD